MSMAQFRKLIAAVPALLLAACARAQPAQRHG